MDEQVIKAMARWPDVPAVYGWLRLDRRGHWHLIDRNQPGFDEARDGAGSPITSPPIIAFIERNYTHDDDGRWFWQNGPQRVFVDVDAAPLVLRVLGEADAPHFVANTGESVRTVDSAWAGPDDELLLMTDLGAGAVHDLDIAALELDEASEGLTLRLGERLLPVRQLDDPPTTLGFVKRPRASTG